MSNEGRKAAARLLKKLQGASATCRMVQIGNLVWFVDSEDEAGLEGLPQPVVDEYHNIRAQENALAQKKH